MKVTKREILFFAIGILTVLMIETVLNWEESKTAFIKGLNGDPLIESTK